MAENLWISFAFLTASIFATVSLFDKIVLDKNLYTTLTTSAVSSIPMYLLFIVVGIVTGNTLVSEPTLNSGTLALIGLSILTGVVHAVSITANFFGLEMSDVSTFVPLVSTDVILVALLAFLFLGEEFSWPIYLGIGVIFLGVVLISLDLSQGLTIGSPRTIYMGLFVAALFGLTDILLKYLTFELNMFEILFWYGVGGIAAFGVYGGWRAISNPTTSATVFLSGIANVGGLFVVTRGIGLGIGFFTLTRALELGPVSLVITIVKLQVLLVFFAAIVLTKLTPEVLYEHVDARVFVQKFTASVLIILGVVVIQTVIS